MTVKTTLGEGEGMSSVLGGIRSLLPKKLSSLFQAICLEWKPVSGST
jgi:hypothetical protein